MHKTKETDNGALNGNGSGASDGETHRRTAHHRVSKIRKSASLQKKTCQLGRQLLVWQAKCGRQLPWRPGRTPFGTLLAQVLLQHTDERRLTLVYDAFLRQFPTPKHLANARPQIIRAAIRDLGISDGTSKLKSLAQALVKRHGGEVPSAMNDLRKLPGVGAGAAATTLIYAFGGLGPHVNADFARIIRRYFGISFINARPEAVARLVNAAHLAQSASSPQRLAQAVSDFASTICTLNEPKCRCCPLQGHCATEPNQKSRRIIGLDVFCGAGGLSAGADMHGVDLVYAFDGDQRAARTYEFNFPGTAVIKERLEVGRVRNLCTALGLRKGSIDLVLAGPPCQGFSISNLRTRDSANPANHAWKCVIELISYLRPKGVIIENVGGIESYQNGAVAKTIERSLAKLGYNSKRYLLDAVNFGVPQRRKRVFFLAVSTGRLPEEIQPESNKTVSVKTALSDLPRLPNGNPKDELPYRLHGRALTQYQKLMRHATNGTVKNCQTSRNTPLILRRFARVRQGGNWSDIPDALFTTYAKKENCHRWLYRRLAETKPSVTISNFRKNMLIHPWQHRTLSVREAARLQGIHDGFVLFGNLQSQQQQIANAVPPPVASAVVQIVLQRIRGETDAQF